MKVNKLFTRLGTTALLATAVTVAATPAQAGTLTRVNFDEEVGVGGNPLAEGPEINNLWKKDYGLNMKSNVKKLWLYNSNCEGDSCTGGDEDLATGKGRYTKNGKTIEYKSPEQGNVLIIQENSSDEADDYYNKNKKGVITFNFTDKNDAGEKVGVLFDSIGLLDFDEKKQPEFRAFFADNSNTNGYFKYGTNKGNKYIDSVDILSTNWDGTKEVKDDNSLREYQFDFGDKRVTKFQIKLPGSGAITGLNYYRENKSLKDVTKKVPEPASILGLAAVSGLAASSLKRKRKSSNSESIQ